MVQSHPYRCAGENTQAPELHPFLASNGKQVIPHCGPERFKVDDWDDLVASKGAADVPLNSGRQYICTGFAKVVGHCSSCCCRPVWTVQAEEGCVSWAAD